MSNNLKRKKWAIVVLFIIAASLILFLIARCNIKKELTDAPFDITEKAYLYSYGLGLTENNNWLGRVKIKIVGFYSSGNLLTEYFYDKNGNICNGTSYYETGQIECTGPMIESKLFGQTLDDGITREYYKSGQLKAEYGRCPGGCCIIFHGINREYSEEGKLLIEQYFINDKERSKTEWLEWLKKHPEDIKYSDSNYDRFIWIRYTVIGIIVITLAIIFLFRKSKNSKIE